MNDKIVENINVAVIRSGMKKNVIAERVGLSAVEFSQLLHNKRKVKAELLPLLAKAMNTDINCFFEGVD